MTTTSDPQRGTALVEILIVIVLSSVLIGLFLHADLAVNRSILRWTYRGGLEQTAMRAGKQLRRDIGRCDSLRFAGETDLDIFASGGAIIHYSFRDSTITRDGRELLPPGVTLASLRFEPLASALDVQSDIVGVPEEKQQALTIVLDRGQAASQTLIIPVRPYSSRHIP